MRRARGLRASGVPTATPRAPRLRVRAPRWPTLLLLVLLPGCTTLRLGGPRPVDFTALAVLVGPESRADTVRATLSRTGADVVFLLAPRGEEWFTAAFPEGLHSAPTSLNPGTTVPPGPDPQSGPPPPGAAGEVRAGVRGVIGLRQALLPDSSRKDGLPPLRPPPLPPTLRAEARGRVRERDVHLMAVSLPAGDRASMAAAATDLLAHIAGQVPGDAVVTVAVALEAGADGRLLDELVGAYLRGAGDCDLPGEPDPGLRLYYAPVALVDCLQAVPLEDGSGILFRLRTRG